MYNTTRGVYVNMIYDIDTDDIINKVASSSKILTKELMYYIIFV